MSHTMTVTNKQLHHTLIIAGFGGQGVSKTGADAGGSVHA